MLFQHMLQQTTHDGDTRGLFQHGCFCSALAPPTPSEVTAQFTSASSVRVIWQWTSSGPAPNTTRVTYSPEGGDEFSLQLSGPAATEATLTDLQCNTNYTITVVATAGDCRKEGVVFLSWQGILNASIET